MSLFQAPGCRESCISSVEPNLDVPPSTFDGLQVYPRKRSIPDVPVDIEFYLEELDTSTEKQAPPPNLRQYPQFGDPFISESRRGSWIGSPSTSNSSLSPGTGDRRLENEFSLNSEDWESPPPDDCSSSASSSPTTSSVISQLDALALNVKSLSGGMYSELEIETKPEIFKHNYLIIREESHIGPCPLRYGEDGYLSLKSFASNTVTATLWLTLQACAIREKRSDPNIRKPAFFEEHATLIFVERHGRYTSGGDPLFEFLGNYYVRTDTSTAVDDSEEHRVLWNSALTQSPLSASAFSGIPLSSASRIELQFIR